MKAPGIHHRLLISVFLLIGAMTFALGYMSVSIINEFIRTRFENRISFLTRQLAVNSVLGILIDERIMLKRLARSLLAEKDVLRVKILNSSDDVLVDMPDLPEKEQASSSVVEAPVFPRESRDESMAFQSAFIEDPENRPIGKVRVNYSAREIERILTLMKFRFFYFSLGLAVIASVLFYFISRSLVAPISHLVEASRRVANGDLELRAVPGKLPETRELVLAFNTMLDSIQEKRKALDEANQKMIQQKTLAEMGKFSLIIAHEFKNPLGIIKSSLDILKKEIDKPSKETMIGYIEDEVQRLNRLVEDFLLFARPVSPTFRAVDIDQMINDLIDRFELQSDGAAIEFKRRIRKSSVEVDADPDLMTRAMGNIIKNAIDACNPEGVVEISTQIADSSWVARIKDDGPGIDENIIHKIFDPFFTTRSKGTGLGLAFASQVIGAHGGNLSVENAGDGGAMFLVKIPVMREKNGKFADYSCDDRKN